MVRSTDDSVAQPQASVGTSVLSPCCILHKKEKELHNPSEKFRCRGGHVIVGHYKQDVELVGCVYCNSPPSTLASQKLV